LTIFLDWGEELCEAYTLTEFATEQVEFLLDLGRNIRTLINVLTDPHIHLAATTAPVARRRATTQRPPVTVESACVLIVDDNSEIRRFLAQEIHRLKLIPEEASSGLEAIRLARARAASGQPYDLILLDVLMPHLDGLEVLETRICCTRSCPAPSSKTM
jgi:PleD family two-component response regulator